MEVGILFLIVALGVFELLSKTKPMQKILEALYKLIEKEQF